MLTIAAIIYGIGVLAGLIATQGGWGSRLGLALLWPLGPLAFVVTVAGLLVVAGIAFPLFGVIFAGAAIGVWWVAR